MEKTNTNVTGNVFLNWVSEKMLHANKAGSGKEFMNVSIPCPQSATGYGSFGVNLGQVLDAKKRDGSVVAGYKSILLGKADGTRKVSICTKTGKKPVYENIEMTNAAIREAVEANRKAYRASQATEQATA